MVSKERALELLIAGVSETNTADVLGCDVSYISQLKTDAEFSTALARGRMKMLTAASARDNTYDSIEDKLLRKFDEMVDYIHKPGEILVALIKINAMKRRGMPAGLDVETGQANLVPLTLPQFLTVNVEVNNQNEVVSVDGTPMVTASIRQVAQIAGVEHELAKSKPVEIQRFVQREAARTFDVLPTR